MKNYLFVLLSVLGIGYLVSSGASASVMQGDNEAFSGAAPIAEVASLEEMNGISEIYAAEITEVAEITTPVYNYAPVLAASYTAPSVPNYTISNRTYDNTVEYPNYSQIYAFNSLVYAHSTSNLLAGIKNLSYGSIFTITENGVTTTYQVQDIRVFEKVNRYNLRLCTDSIYANYSYSTPCSGPVTDFGTITYGRFFNESRARIGDYQVVLDTCHGEPNGAGDASHRWIVFANQI